MGLLRRESAWTKAYRQMWQREQRFLERYGTAADRMEGQVAESVKRERAQKLISLGNKLEENYVLSMVDTVRRVLFEQPAGGGFAEGYTGEYVRVRAAAEPGMFSCVRIVRAEGTLAIGEPVALDGR